MIPYHERAKCLVCRRPAGPFGSSGFPDFCDCDQRERVTFPPRLTPGPRPPRVPLVLHDPLEPATSPGTPGPLERG